MGIAFSASFIKIFVTNHFVLYKCLIKKALAKTKKKKIYCEKLM
jgi:hypothetical protein